jgi:hypothetical protein
MKIDVVTCWSRGEDLKFRCTLRGEGRFGGRFYVPGSEWTRKVAKEALDIAELHGVNRKSVRFVHH